MKPELLREMRNALDQVDPRDLRRESASLVWRLATPGLLAAGCEARRKAVQECKYRLLEAFAACGPAYLRHPENPADYGVPGSWSRDSSGTSRLPADVDVDDPRTRHWLFDLGNWQAYVAPAPVREGWLDPSRADPDALIQWMSHVEIDALIDSFHDDVSWMVAVVDGPAVGEERSSS